MDKVDKHIDERFGRKAPFRVPEGYFDDFAARMMSQLPAEGEAPQQAVTVAMRPTLWQRWRKAACVAAASVAVAVVGLGAYMHHESASADKAQLAGAPQQAATTSYSSADAFADYAMLDADDMYAYMADIK